MERERVLLAAIGIAGIFSLVYFHRPAASARRRRRPSRHVSGAERSASRPRPSHTPTPNPRGRLDRSRGTTLSDLTAPQTARPPQRVRRRAPTDSPPPADGLSALSPIPRAPDPPSPFSPPHPSLLPHLPLLPPLLARQLGAELRRLLRAPPAPPAWMALHRFLRALPAGVRRAGRYVPEDELSAFFADAGGDGASSPMRRLREEVMRLARGGQAQKGRFRLVDGERVVWSPSAPFAHLTHSSDGDSDGDTDGMAERVEALLREGRRRAMPSVAVQCDASGDGAAQTADVRRLLTQFAQWRWRCGGEAEAFDGLDALAAEAQRVLDRADGEEARRSHSPRWPRAGTGTGELHRTRSEERRATQTSSSTPPRNEQGTWHGTPSALTERIITNDHSNRIDSRTNSCQEGRINRTRGNGVGFGSGTVQPAPMMPYARMQTTSTIPSAPLEEDERHQVGLAPSNSHMDEIGSPGRSTCSGGDSNGGQRANVFERLYTPRRIPPKSLPPTSPQSSARGKPPFNVYV